MNYFHGLRRRLSGKDRAWWNLFSVRFDDSQFQVVERRIFARDRVQSVQWQEIQTVCFVDGGLGSDVFCIYNSRDPQQPPVQVPTESQGGQLFWEQLKQRGLFPESVSGQAMRSDNRGNQICWPPRAGA